MKKSKFLILILILSFTIPLITACTTKPDMDDNTNTKDDEQVDAKEDDAENAGEDVVVEDTKEDTKEDTQEEDSKEDYGIKNDEKSVTLIDGRGEEVTIDKNPERVVVLFGSYIDIWTRNGGKMVGMIEDTSGEEIPGTEDVERVGKFGSISLEKLISLEPDLVILSSNAKSQVELIPALEDNKIPLLIVDYLLRDDYFKVVRLFSAINDREDLYEENGEKVLHEVEAIIEKAPKDENPKVFIMFASSKSISSRGSDSTTGEMLKDLNAINIADTASDLLNEKAFSLEKVLEEDPDFIFVQTMGSDMDKVTERIKSDAESNPAWASLSAVKNDRYIFLPKDLYMYKANHRYPEAYEGLAKTLYPETFK